MTGRNRQLLLICFLILAAPSLSGQPRLTPDSGMLRIGLISDPLPLSELSLAALTASGTDDMENGLARLSALLEAVPPVSDKSTAESAELLLQWMHEEYLTRYIERQTSVAVLLENGTYNCVSSAVLYMIILESRRIPVHGVLTSDHAFCRIPLQDGGIDVETTTEYGFDPGSRKNAEESFTGRTGFTYVPPGQYRQRQDIGSKEMVSLIYQNRISDLQRTGRWEEAVGLALDRWTLTGTEAARIDFLNAVTNYAADLDRKRKFSEGLMFLNQASSVMADGLEDTAGILLNNAVTWQLRSNNPDGAFALLNDQELTALVPAETVLNLFEDTARKELELLLQTAPFSESLDAVEMSYQTGLITQARRDEFVLYLWSAEAQKRSAGSQWLDAWLFLRDASETYSSSAGWKRMAEQYRYNAVISFHNRFAAAVRQNDLSNAERILDEADVYFPDEELFTQDRQTLENF